MSESLMSTLLYPWHAGHGARFGEFAGWDMPIQYDRGAIAEHRLVRGSAGLFDVSHMGRFLVRGPDSGAYLDHLFSAPMANLAINQSTYALMCAEDGGVLDDVFVYRLGAGSVIETGCWMVVVNAANRRKDLSWMNSHAARYDVTIEDHSEQLSMIAFQGPNAIAITDILSDGMAGSLPRFGAVQCTVNGAPCILGRTGYTGEDGVELYAAPSVTVGLWESLLRQAERRGVEAGPVGLAARDSLRFEPGFALYGHELNEDTTPVESGLKWACDFDKQFVGRDAILRRQESGVRRRLITLQLTDRGVPRQGCSIYATEESTETAGLVVSGMYAPTADGYFANAFVDSAHAAKGTDLFVDIRGRRKAAIVVKRPIYRPAYR